VLLDLISIISATACHQRNYVERYSRYIKAAYNLFKHPEATLDHVPAGHREVVLSEMQTPGVYLRLEETTALSFSGRKPVPGLGPIGNGAAGLQGFFVHAVLGALLGSYAPPRGAPVGGVPQSHGRSTRTSL
jgi:hypothetical protein